MSSTKLSNICLYKDKIKSLPKISKYNANPKKLKVREKVLDKIKNSMKCKIILGSGHSLGYKDKNASSYISTDQDELDLLNRFEITKYIPQDSMSIIFANHVLEHIYPDKIWNVLENIYFMNKPNGYLVICVPDLLGYKSIFYKNKEQSLLFQPKADHHILFSLASLSFMLNNIGYNVTPLFYHNKKGNCIIDDYNIELLNDEVLISLIKDSIKMHKYALCISSIKREK